MSKLITFEEISNYSAGTDFWDHNPEYTVVREVKNGVRLFETHAEAERWDQAQ